MGSSRRKDEGVTHNDEVDGVLTREQTRQLFYNVVPKLCINMRPRDINAALLLELMKHSPSRGGRQIRLWTTSLFRYNRHTNPKSITVSLPRELKNGNAEQKAKNVNLQDFKIFEDSNLFKLLVMIIKLRGPHVTTDALFVHPYKDNEWRVSS